MTIVEAKAALGETLQRGFVHILIEDVTNALERVEASDTEGHRREAVRTIWVATEGLVWVYREHTRVTANDLRSLTPLLDLALREKTYVVSEDGSLVEQTRFISLPSMIRMTTKLAEKAFPPFKADFSHAGWSKLKDAVKIRNRLVHPKSMADLSVSVDDVLTAKAGFFWLLALVLEGMTAANAALSKLMADAVELLEDLRSGDEAALAEYRAALEDD